MKRMLHLPVFGFIFLLAFISNVDAQSQVYFREGFNEGEGTLGSVNTGSVPGQYFTQTNSGTWYGYGVYRSNGPTGSCVTAGGLSHIRFANLNTITTTNDSAYLVTPVLNYGINTLTFYNGRAARRFTILKTIDTLATSANWTYVDFIPADNLACDVETVTVNDPAAKRLKIVARGGTDSDVDSIVISSTSPILLPVNFSNVTAFQKNNGVEVEWVAAAELNVSGYAVEKSVNGSSFLEVASVKANGNSTTTTTYNWFDASPNQGNNFYRIKAIDKDGNVKFTSVMKVVSGNGLAAISIAPNPVKGSKLTLVTNSMAKGIYTLNIYNSTGQKVYTEKINHPGGSSSQMLQLPSAIKRGMYNLELSNNTIRLSKGVLVE